MPNTLTDEQTAPETPMAIVARQAEDERLWFVPVYITEDTLQRALRELHAAIEGISLDEAARRALAKARGEQS